MPPALSRLMNDGVRAGTKLGQGEQGAHVKPGLSIPSVEIDRVKKILQAASKQEMLQDELSVRVDSLGSMYVTLRKDTRNGGRSWYLNMDGNPLKFLRGRNVYGYENASAQIVSVFKRCLRAIEKMAAANTGRDDTMKFPKRVWDAVDAKDIYLYALEFATYTGKLEDKQKVLNAWKYIYRRANWRNPMTKRHESLADMLGVKFMEFTNSIVIASLNTQGATNVTLSVYDKEQEVLAPEQPTLKVNGRKRREDATVEGIPAGMWKHARDVREPRVPEDIRDRLRLEICLTRVWFNSRGVNTLADLEAYMGRTGLTWTTLAQKELGSLMEKACLIDMWKFHGQAVIDAFKKELEVVPGLNPRIKTDAWMTILDARAEMMMEREELIAKHDPGSDKKAWLKMMETYGLLSPLPNIYKMVQPEKNLRLSPSELKAH